MSWCPRRVVGEEGLGSARLQCKVVTGCVWTLRTLVRAQAPPPSTPSPTECRMRPGAWSCRGRGRGAALGTRGQQASGDTVPRGGSSTLRVPVGLARRRRGLPGPSLPAPAPFPCPLCCPPARKEGRKVPRGVPSSASEPSGEQRV